MAPKLPKKKRIVRVLDVDDSGMEDTRSGTASTDLVVKQYLMGTDGDGTGATKISAWNSNNFDPSNSSTSESSSDSGRSDGSDIRSSSDVLSAISLSTPAALVSDSNYQLSNLGSPRFSSIVNHNITLKRIVELNPAMRMAFDHYVGFTCSSIDPVNGDNSQNISKTMYLPLALNSMSSLYGILSLSAFQLSFTNPAYKEVGYQARVLSYQQLSSLVAQCNNSWNLDILGSILVHLTIDVLEPTSNGWSTHLQLFRSLFQETPLLNWHKHGILAWYITSRFVKYDTFACLQTGQQPLITWDQFDIDEMVNNEKLDASWSCPSRPVVFCAEISHAYSHPHDIDWIYMYRVIYQLENAVTETSPATSWQKTTRYWCLGAILFAHRTILAQTNKQSEIQIMVVKMIDILKTLAVNDFMVTALVWPTWLLASVVTDSADRLFLLDFLEQAATEVRVISFRIIRDLAISFWAQSDLSHKQWLHQAALKDWNQLMA